ncbi:MAG: hypothetical protein ACJAWV_000274 [Flammeovirgaceae bacterium]|jgi:hypothetical protein
MKFFREIFILLLVFTFSACDKEEEFGVDLSEGDYLVFGHFYGFCAGETCVENYLIKEGELYKDLKKDYLGREFDFQKLDNSEYLKVQDLTTSFPLELLNEQNERIGCPDCTDQGGVSISYSKNGNIRRWRIDQYKPSIPSYLHDFVDKVNQKISLLDNQNISCSESVVVSATEFDSVATIKPAINSLRIDGDCLTINLSASGCSGDSWELKLVDSGEVRESTPAKRELKLFLKNTELCQAYLAKEVSFDISALQVGGNSVLLEMADSELEILYQY